MRRLGGREGLEEEPGAWERFEERFTESQVAPPVMKTKRPSSSGRAATADWYNCRPVNGRIMTSVTTTST